MRKALLLSFLIVLFGCEGGSGVTGPTIDYSRTTDFMDGVLSIFVEDDLTLGTDKDLVSTAPYAPDMPGHTTGRSWTLLSRTEDRTYLVYALASWDENDPTDYLTAGWWVRFEGQEFDLDAEDNQYAAFWDGPDADLRNVESMPKMGTASYDGPMGGRFRYRYGDDWGEDKGNTSLEEFAAYVTIEADFEAGTFSTCIGCVGDITIQRLHLKSAYEQLLPENPFVPLKADPKDYEIHIAPVQYNPDGTFIARDPELISVKHPEREAVSVSRAFWAGSFSGLKDGNDNPRVIGGFLNVRSEEEDGSSPDFLGVFNAPSESFRQSGKK